MRNLRESGRKEEAILLAGDPHDCFVYVALVVYVYKLFTDLKLYSRMLYIDKEVAYINLAIDFISVVYLYAILLKKCVTRY